MQLIRLFVNFCTENNYECNIDIKLSRCAALQSHQGQSCKPNPEVTPLPTPPRKLQAKPMISDLPPSPDKAAYQTPQHPPLPPPQPHRWIGAAEKQKKRRVEKKENQEKSDKKKKKN